VILGMAVTAGGRWMVSLRDYSGTVQRVSGDERALMRTVAMLRDDLFESVAGSVTVDLGVDELALTTANRVPNETTGHEWGWRDVRWSYDERDERITRRSVASDGSGVLVERTVAVGAGVWLLTPTIRSDETEIQNSVTVELAIGAGEPQRIVVENVTRRKTGGGR